MRFKLKHGKPIDNGEIYLSYRKMLKRFSLLCFLLLFLLNLFLFRKDEMNLKKIQPTTKSKRFLPAKNGLGLTPADLERLEMIELEE